ncbi:6-phosphogluconolactonase [Lyngbya sp. PCC 8106]|uniref:6-phosphogluconolactonase n=1 Tax=Lyngbya sp. (strain PCC 8106) TaxID=313612 RepID=UPI0000EAD619|nr:6-phosphogluconolactonase [Lyngbya sp. PCC 8106]EAW37662.1 6-phosphogluconolactonase [Lyngbya sp. PCC 8106]
MKKNIEVFPSRDQLVERAKSIILDKIEPAIKQRGRFTLVLAGGGTPKPLYEALATENLPLDKIHIFWGDERYVPSDHPDSNEGMARQAWLDCVAFPAENIHPMPTGGNDPLADSRQYEAQLQKFFQVSEGEFPAFDVILLGMGDDAHTASLFPHTEALQVRDRLIAVGNKAGQPRLTFTVPLINQAECVLFLVTGANKQPALTQVFAETADEMAYPSRAIQPQGELWWLFDEAAGQAVPSS